MIFNEPLDFQRASAESSRCSDGTPFVRMKEVLTRGMAYIEPGKTVVMEIEAEPGALRGNSTDGDAGFHLPVDPVLPRTAQRIEIRCDENSCEPDAGAPAPGKVTLDIVSSAAKRFLLGVVQFPPGVEGPPPFSFAPFLSGRRLLTTQTFRHLFRSEVIGSNEGIGVKDLALLFTDVKGLTALYDRMGDVNAFALVQQHFEQLQRVTTRHGGAIIKSIGDAIMVAFVDPADAVAAAIDMRREIAAFNLRQPDRALILKIGVHRGAAIAATLNDRLDCFGPTVNTAARVQNLADADEICISRDAYDADGVKEKLAPFAIESRDARLRGLEQSLQAFPVAAREAPRPIV